MSNANPYVPTIDSLLFLMANLSPLVAENLREENYRNRADSDGATDEYILEDCFHKLMQDVQTLGLEFDIEMADFVDDKIALSHLLELLSYIMPNALYAKIKSESRIRDLINLINSGTLEAHHTTVESYLVELAGLDSELPIVPDLTEFIDELLPKISQTPTFTMYFKHLIDLYSTEVITPPSDDERHTAYRAVIKDVIGNIGDAVNLFENTLEFADIQNIQNVVIHDFCASENFIDYAYLLLENTDTLPEELQEGYTRKWYYYFVSNPWCLDYHLVRAEGEPGVSLNSPMLMFMLCFYYGIAKHTSNSFDHYAERVTKRHPDALNTYYKIQNKLAGKQ